MYSNEQIGPKLIRPISSKSKDRYRLYVQNPPSAYHELILAGVSWQQCRMRAVEMISLGVDWIDIYGDVAGMRRHTYYDVSWGNARHHLWWSILDDDMERTFAKVLDVVYR